MTTLLCWGLVAIATPAADAGTLWLHIGAPWNGNCVGPFFSGASAAGFPTNGYCGPGTQSGMIISAGGVGPAGARGYWQTNAPPGVTINSVWIPLGDLTVDNINQSGSPWGGGDYWQGGGTPWASGQTAHSAGGFNSPYYGFQITCPNGGCGSQAAILVRGIQLQATENQGPSLVALGADNLWYQGGHWIWNPPGDPWSIALSTLYPDPSGICNMWATANGRFIQGPSAAPNTAVWHQCPDETWSGPGATVDTRSYVLTSGPLPLTLAASNAAGVTSAPSETLAVDNDPVGVSLSTPNDPNPTLWVNHAVTVTAAASAGPSGVGGVNCSVDRGAVHGYTSAGVTVDGDGTHPVTCTAWNQAIGPQGQRHTGTSSMPVKIDEAPPSVALEPQNPADPTQLVIDTADGESGVGGGSVAIAPAGTNSWTALPTSSDGQHLLARLDDAGLGGPYTIQATSCDNVGNCASTAENLTLPLRLAAESDVSFRKINIPAKVVRKRVLVGFHYKRVRRHGELVTVKSGGHYRTIRLVIHVNTRCAHRRVKTGRRRWREITVCRKMRLHLVRTRRVAYGKRVTLHGLLMTGQGVPI
ncbi:MAG TPA: hypothetical protein VEH31_45770, partial [Streptosporangiaceae bacterium]|nr:hypothetical protein [Streptosporangiaceae bacterium]